MSVSAKTMNTLFYTIAGSFIVCIGSIVLLQEIMFKEASDDIKEAYGDRIASLCDPVPDTGDVLTRMPTGPTPYQVLVLEAGTSRTHAWHNALTASQRATGQADVDLVVCVRKVELEGRWNSCETSDGGRWVYDAPDKPLTEAIILNATTGERIARLRFLNLEEDRYLCEADTFFSLMGDGHATPADFVTAIAPYITGTIQ